MLVTFKPDPITHPGFTSRTSDSLHARVNELAGNRFADSTLKSYTSRVNLFVIFCQVYALLIFTAHYVPGRLGTVLLPTITPALLCFFIVWMEKRGHTTYGSIMAYVIALCAWCKTRGRPDPRNTADGVVHDGYFSLCHGLKRAMGDPPPTRYPVTLWHTDKLHVAAHQMLPHKQCANMQAATKLAFALLLRVSEFTTEGQHDPTRHASRSDVTFLPNIDNPITAHVLIKYSKMDQLGKGCVLVASRAANPDRCPVLALQKLFRVDPQPPGAPLFNFNADAAPTRSATRTRFSKVCNQLFAFAQVDSMFLKAHSFRQGGATALLAAGAPEWVVKVMGRWKSDCWHAYAFTDPQHIATWSCHMHSLAATPVDYHANPPKRIMDYGG